MDGEGKLSALDAAFLFFERPGEPLVLGCVLELERSPGLCELGAALLRAVAAVPRLMSIPRRVPFDLDRPSWTPDRSFSLGRHIGRLTLTDPGDATALAEALEPLLSRALPEDRPPWDATLIEGGAGRPAVVVIRAHQCMVDGMAGLRILDTLTDPLPLAGESAGARQTTSHRPRAGASVRAALAAPGALWDRVKDVAEIANTAASLFHDDQAPRLPFNGALSPRRRMAWIGLDLDEARTIARHGAATVNDVVLATISDGVRRWLGRRGTGAAKRLRIAVPVSLHGDDDPTGNLFSIMLPSLPLDAAAPLVRLERVRTETRRLRQRGQPRAVAFLLGAASALPASIEALLPRLVPEQPVVNAVVTNVPGPAETRTLAGVTIRALHGHVPLFRGMGLGFAVLSHAGRLSLAATYDPEQVRDVRGLQRALQRSFSELRRATRAAGESTGHEDRVPPEEARPPRATKRPQASAAPTPTPRRARGYRTPTSLAHAAELVAVTTPPVRRRAAGNQG